MNGCDYPLSISAVPQSTVQVRPVAAQQQGSTITMTPTTAMRPGTARIVRQRSPVAMTSQGVKVVGSTPGSQPQIISIPGGQAKTIVTNTQAVSFNVL